MIDLGQIALVVPTIDRPLAVQRLVRTAMRFLPGIRIYVGDQSRADPFMDAFYRDNDVEAIRAPFDCGVSATRNLLVEQVQEEFFLLCDDDFIFSAETDVAQAVRILRAAADVGVVGGRLHESVKGQRFDRFYEMYFSLNRDARTLTSFPIHYFAPNPRIVAGITAFPCDALLNFAVFRRSMFSQTVRWDPLFKSDGEHEDFYLNLKINSDWSALYLPSMVAEHDRPETVGYERKRKRRGGWRAMMQKWDIDQYLELGAGLRTIVDDSAFFPEPLLTRSRFYASGTLTHGGDPHQKAGTFEVLEDTARPLTRYINDGDPAPGGENLVAGFEVEPGKLVSAGIVSQASQVGEATPMLIVTTMDRPGAVQRLVRTAREHFPDIAILVGDQSAPDPFMDEFYAAYDVSVIRLPYDIGLSAARNALVDHVEDEFFVLCDDDFVFTGETDFGPALQLLRGQPEIGIVGGRVKNVDYPFADAQSVDWAKFIEFDEARRLLSFVPMHLLAPKPSMHNGIQFYRCDAVLNFAVFRRAIFDAVVRWDPLIRSDGEHEDFYLNIKQNADVGIAFLPSLSILHNRPEARAYERMRARTGGWRRFFDKWNVRAYLELGAGLRDGQRVDRFVPQQLLSRENYFSGSWSLHQRPPVPGAFDLGDDHMVPLYGYVGNGEAVFDAGRRWFTVSLDSQPHEAGQ